MARQTWLIQQVAAGESCAPWMEPDWEEKLGKAVDAINARFESVIDSVFMNEGQRQALRDNWFKEE